MQKNTSTTKIPLIEAGDFSSMFSESRIFEWIANNGKILAYFLLGLLAFAFLIYRMSSSNQVQAEKDYFSAANDLAQLQRLSKSQDLVAAQEPLNRLITIVERHPELHAQYDGTIAQILINMGNAEEAKKFATPTLQRISQDDFPYYIDYANNTITISDKQYPEALKQALDLKQKMLTQMSANQDLNQSEFDNIFTLFALNFLRIGMLQQIMGNEEGELKTWQEWHQYAESKNPISSAFITLNQQVAEEKMILADYIEHRQKVLKK